MNTCLYISFNIFSNINTLELQYNAPRYNAKSDTTLIFLGSQMTFKKSLRGSADKKFIYFHLCHHILIKIFIYICSHRKKRQLKILDVYKYRCILTKIFSLDEKTDVTRIEETNFSSHFPKYMRIWANASERRVLAPKTDENFRLICVKKKTKQSQILFEIRYI